MDDVLRQYIYEWSSRLAFTFKWRDLKSVTIWISVANITSGDSDFMTAEKNT